MIAGSPVRRTHQKTAGPLAGMRLFFIVENYHPHAAAGGCYAIYKFGEFLARRGHAVFIVGVHDKQWVRPGGNLSLGFRPRLPWQGQLALRLDWMLGRFWSRWLLPGTVRRFRPDWIIGFLTHSAIKADRLGRAFGIPVANFVYECPPWMEEVLRPQDARVYRHPYSRDLWEKTRQAYLGSKVLMPNSSLSRQYNMSWLGGKELTEPIHPGIDPVQMPFEEPSGDPALKLSRERRHLLFLGRLVENKNIGDLIAAFFKLGTDAELHLCGSGPDLEKLKAQARSSKRIHFHGFLPDDALWSLFRQCHLVVYPSEFEGFGMPPMQALYFGKPCLVSDLPIFRSIYGDRLEYFPPRDVEALAAAMGRLLADPEYCRRRGESGHRFILENFTWEYAAERIEKHLLEAKG